MCHGFGAKWSGKVGILVLRSAFQGRASLAWPKPLSSATGGQDNRMLRRYGTNILVCWW